MGKNGIVGCHAGVILFTVVPRREEAAVPHGSFREQMSGVIEIMSPPGLLPVPPRRRFWRCKGKLPLKL